jgi:glycosyltransferase involved in cell wall biosynthesis
MDIAILVPCFDDEEAIGKVAQDLRRHLPGCNMFVYDNASTDRTSQVEAAAGAIVRREPLPGKGNVVRRKFADVEADGCVLVDSDDTHDAASASLDLVTGGRAEMSQQACRRGHRFGNSGFPAVVEYLQTGVVARLPTAVLATGLALLGILSLVCG